MFLLVGELLLAGVGGGVYNDSRKEYPVHVAVKVEGRRKKKRLVGEGT